jgi:hypothetical protein
MELKAAKELLHIQSWLSRVHEIVRRGKEAYLTDDLLQEAGDSLMMKLGEAANRLSRLDVLAPGNVEWALAVANRNFIIISTTRSTASSPGSRSRETYRPGRSRYKASSERRRSRSTSTSRVPIPSSQQEKTALALRRGSPSAVSSGPRTGTGPRRHLLFMGTIGADRQRRLGYWCSPDRR